MKTGKITVKLVRSFALGFTVYSPKLNGWVCFDLMAGCFHLSVWSRGSKWFSVANYWGG